MMRVNQYNNSAFTQNTQNRTNRSGSNTPSFAGIMNNISSQQQAPQMPSQQSDTTQMPGMNSISGMQNNFPGMMPGNMPEMPSMPDGETPLEMPDDVASVDGAPSDLPEIPSGELPPSAPSESDGNMSQPPSGMPGMNGMSSFRAMSFMNR